MPRKPINYSNACIYKLCSKDINIKDIYIGSTTNFTKRKCQHKNNSLMKGDKEKHNLKVYQFIYNNGGWNNWEMILIDNNLNVNNKLELKQKERHYYELLKPTLNSQYVGRTYNEYQKEYNKTEKQKKYKKEYMKNYDSIKIKCEICNCEVIKRCYNYHINSKKHKKNLDLTVE